DQQRQCISRCSPATTVTSMPRRICWRRVSVSSQEKRGAGLAIAPVWKWNRRPSEPGKAAEPGRAAHEILRARAREGARCARISFRAGRSADPGAARPGVEAPGGRDLPYARLPRKSRLSASRAGDRRLFAHLEAFRALTNPFPLRVAAESGGAP